MLPFLWVYKHRFAFMIRLFLGCLFGCWLVQLAQAQPPIELRGQAPPTKIGQRVAYYIDPSRNKSLAEVQQENFTISNEEIINLGVNQAAVWLRVSFDRQSEGDYYLFLEHPLLDSVFYAVPGADGSYQGKWMGRNFPLQTENIVASWYFLPLASRPGSSEVYLRLTSTRYAFVEATVMDHDSRMSYLFGRFALDFTFFGILVFAILYNLFIYFSVRDVSYLHYVCYTFLIGLSIFSTKGYIIVLWPALAEAFNQYNSLIGLLYVPFVSLFSIYFLRSKEYSTFWHNYFKLAVGISLGQIGLITLGLAQYLVMFNIVFLFLNRVLHVTGAISIYLKGYKPAIYYIISWGIFTLFTAYSVLSYNEFFPLTYLTKHLTFSAIAIETIICSLALANRINALKRESLEAQLANIELVRQQNERLEQEVQKRTYELEDKKTQIEAQNQELQNQKGAIQQLNDNLEELVGQRTRELREALDNLTKQNQDLSQFSYIVSHNLRSPVARVMGLINIFENSQLSEAETQELMGHLRSTSRDLDTIMRDLNDILSIRTKLNTHNELVDLVEVAQDEKAFLRDEVGRAGAVIQVDFAEVGQLYSVKSYVRSILHNLLSNSLKYRSSKRKPVIQVTTCRAPGYTCLSVQDNGMGMDLSNLDQYKIFGLYQRMHEHTEGKGMGLFLVKTQIESLGGKIEVESEVEVGTTFRVYFPSKNGKD
jgi:two-component system, sensor histidine kinase LadS